MPVLHRLEHRTHCDLGLAEADVSADEPVHRHGLFHVGFHVIDRLQLVRGLRIEEGLLELGLPGCVGRERVAGSGPAAPVQLDELLCYLPDRGAHPSLLAGPLRPAHPVERRRFAAGVGRDGVDLLGGQVEPVAAAVLEQQVVALGATHRPGHHASEAGDAMHVVDDVVARGQVVEETLRRARSRPRLAVRPPPPRHVRFGDDGELRGGDEASTVQRCDDDVHAGAADLDVEPVLRLVEEQAAGEALAVEHGRHPFRTATAVGADDDPVARVGELTQAAGETGGIAQHRLPARGLKRDRARALGDREQRRDLGGGVLQEAVEAEVEPRHPRR